MQTITRAILPRNQSPSVSNSQRGRSCEQIFDSSTTFLNPLVGTNSSYGKQTVGFFSPASHALRACEARALRARKTLTPRFTDFFTDFEKKTDCFAVYTYINFKIVCHNFQCHIKKASIKICLGLGFFVIFFASMQVFCNDTNRQSLH